MRNRLEFRHRDDIRDEDGRILVPACYQGEQRGWMLPGRVFTTSRIEADAAARIIRTRREQK